MESGRWPYAVANNEHGNIAVGAYKWRRGEEGRVWMKKRWSQWVGLGQFFDSPVWHYWLGDRNGAYGP